MDRLLDDMARLGLVEHLSLTREALAFIETREYAGRYQKPTENNAIGGIIVLMGQEWEDWLNWIPLFWADIFNSNVLN